MKISLASVNQVLKAVVMVVEEIEALEQPFLQELSSATSTNSVPSPITTPIQPPASVVAAA